MTTEPASDNDNLNKAIIQWGCDYLSSHGYTLKSNLPENVKNTPWSYLVRFVTSNGYIYLKYTPKLIALEAIINQILRDQFRVSVPDVIAFNAELNCFLMKDAGRPLREILKKQFDVALYCKAIDQFTSMQLVAADHVNIFFDIGVPDWRLDKLPDLFRQLLLQKDILIADGLSETEMSKLQTLLPTVNNLCKKLSDYSIKQSIVQSDFHDNNILIDDISQNITLIDLGEIVISHPFFSLITCLRQLKKHHALTEKDEAYQQIMNACFKNYMNTDSKKDLLDAIATAEILWLVYGALANYRLINACGTEKLISFQPGKFSGELKELMAAFIKYDKGFSD